MALARVNVSSGGKTPKLVSVPVQSGTLTYSGSAKSPTWNGYDATQLTIGGTTSATNAGTYTATFTLKDGYTWADGTSNPKGVTWTIGKAAITLSASISGAVTYGSTGTITVSGNTGGGEITAISSNAYYVAVQSTATNSVTVKCANVSSSAVTITINVATTANYSGGSTTCLVSTAKLSVAVPTVTKTTFTYDDSAHVPTIGTYDSELITAVNTAQTNAGNYSVTFALKNTINYQWGDGTTANKFIPWTINKAAGKVRLSSTSGNVTYGTPKTFTVTQNTSGGTLSVQSEDTTHATVSINDTTVTVNCVKYRTETTSITVTSAETTNYNAATATFTMIAVKAQVTLSLSESSGEIFGQGNTISFEVITPSNGEITATISTEGTTPVTATVNGTTVTLTNIYEFWRGFATITVSQAEGTNHQASTSSSNRRYVVFVRKGKLIKDNWATISTRARNGTAANYYDLGDFKEITLNGNIGENVTFDNTKMYVYILHINYPMNGVAENNIIWGGFLVPNSNILAAIASPRHGAVENEISTSMNHAFQKDDETADGYLGTNYGGWKGSDLRYDILGATSTAPSEYNQRKSPANVGYNATAETLRNPKEDTLLAALPSDFRNALRLWSRWIDAKGNSSNVEENIEETIDAVTLLTEFEVKGTRTYANECEQNHQTQMALNQVSSAYIIHTEYPGTNVAINRMWLPSPASGNATKFGYIYDSGKGITTTYSAYYTCGIAPAFKT